MPWRKYVKKTFDLWDNATKSPVTVEATKAGQSWKALCPKHDDQNPSLDIQEMKGVFYCHGCGWRGHLYNPDRKEKKGILAVYNYRDADGNLSFQVVRYKPKDFRQRRPDGNGGWIYNLEGIEPILYCLPELTKGNDPVFLVEGEKDADRLASMDFTVTTNPMGAGKWRPVFNQFLRNREVVLLPDNDPPGKSHAQKISEQLRGIAKSIKIVELPGLGEGEDVSDFLNRGGSKEDLLKMVKSTPDVSEEYDKGIPLISSVELATIYKQDSIDWLVFQLIPIGSVASISSPPSTYKTWLSLILGKAVGDGTPFLGRLTQRQEVIYIDRENPRSVLSHRLNLVGTSPGLRFYPLWAVPEPPLIWAEVYKSLAVQGRLLIFDSLRHFHTADENSSQEMAKIMTIFRGLATQGATVLILHHMGKGQSEYRGSSEILAGVDVAFTLRKDNTILGLHCIKHRYIQEPSLTIEIQSGDGFFSMTDISEQKDKVREFEEKERLLQIRDIISTLHSETGKYPNQSAVIEKGMGSGLARGVILDSLKKGEGVYWTVQEGDRNTKMFVPVSAFQLSNTIYSGNLKKSHNPSESLNSTFPEGSEKMEGSWKGQTDLREVEI